mmetsp:Transcript_42262/g.102133  ORF Transcript_42262/g.102133 Transcript_42262/m.102133 type:complete len:228 (+) Transcript_42262:1056-1739(+)
MSNLPFRTNRHLGSYCCLPLPDGDLFLVVHSYYLEAVPQSEDWLVVGVHNYHHLGFELDLDSIDLAAVGRNLDDDSVVLDYNTGLVVVVVVAVVDSLLLLLGCCTHFVVAGILLLGYHFVAGILLLSGHYLLVLLHANSHQRHQRRRHHDCCILVVRPVSNLLVMAVLVDCSKTWTCRHFRPTNPPPNFQYFHPNPVLPCPQEVHHYSYYYYNCCRVHSHRVVPAVL